MDFETIAWIVASSGLGTLGTAFMLKTLVTSGIQKAVELNFNKHLERYKATLNQELENLKSTLKNSEVFFIRQLEALSMLRSLYRKILPEKDYPDMEWTEALEKISDAYREHFNRLNDYLCSYDAVLPADVREKLESARYVISDVKFQFDPIIRNDNPIPSSAALESAERFYNLVSESIELLQERIERQLGNRQESASPAKAEKELA